MAKTDMLVLTALLLGALLTTMLPALQYLTFYDNIFAGGTYGIDPATGSQGETFYADYNLFFNQSIDAFEGAITIEGPNNVEATDPEFTNAAGGDFIIPASSPAVGVGSTPGNTS